MLVKFVHIKYNLLQKPVVGERGGALTGCSAEQILAREVRKQQYGI